MKLQEAISNIWDGRSDGKYIGPYHIHPFAAPVKQVHKRMGDHKMFSCKGVVCKT